jgi:glycosyltransferase involved in cell wall biosynthesis
MHILMISPQPFLEPRGTPISVFQRVQGLAALGYTVDLVTYHVGQDVVIDGVTLHRIPRVPFIKQVKVGPSWAKLLLDLLVLWKAVALLLSRPYDVIHSHEEAAYFAGLLARLFRARHLYDMHSSLPRQLRSFNYGNIWPVVQLFEWLEQRTIRGADAMITIDGDLEAYVRSINPAVKLVNIDNLGMQTVRDSSSDQVSAQLAERLGLCERQVILYTGTFERYQGVDLLIASAKLVRDRHPEVIFVLAGGKSQQVKRWEALVRRQELQDMVLFVGTVPIDELSAYFDLAEILVSPRVEGTSVPLKIYTYLQSGKPIVATCLSAHTLVLSDEYAVLTEPKPEAFAEGIVRLIQNPALRQQLGHKGQQIARERYDPAQYLAKLHDVYHTLNPQRIPKHTLIS